MSLQDRVIAKIKEHFPSVEFILRGDGSTGEGFNWEHVLIRHEPQEGSAEDMVIDTLYDHVKDLKIPDLAFIRLVDSGTKMDSSTGKIINSAIARFALGYKL